VLVPSVLARYGRRVILRFVDEYRGKRIVTNGELYGIEGELVTDCRYLNLKGARDAINSEAGIAQRKDFQTQRRVSGTKAEGAGTDALWRDLQLASQSDGSVRLEVRATPRARASSIVGVREGALAVRLAAPPADGAANDELVGLVARALGVACSNIKIVRGHGSRTKLVEVQGLQPADIRSRLRVSRS
jgi:uncharacterized protein (TIGR00251 family)